MPDPLFDDFDDLRQLLGDDVSRQILLPQLFRACAGSSDVTTREYPLRRLFYILIYLDDHRPESEREQPGATLDRIFERSLHELDGVLELHKCSHVFEVGPDYGSRLQLIFASSDDYLIGSSFEERLAAVKASCMSLLVGPMPKGVLIGVVVAGGAITAVGGQVEAAKLFHIPQTVVELIYQTSNAVATAAAVKEILLREKRTTEDTRTR
jgi:hypothetical protein